MNTSEARWLIPLLALLFFVVVAADSRLLERPLVETEKGVRLCRPAERVEEIL